MKKERAELPAQIENVEWCKDSIFSLNIKVLFYKGCTTKFH